MKRRLRRKGRKRRSILMLISVFIISVVIVIALSYQLQLQQPSQKPEKELAENYFEIIDPTVNFGWLKQNDTVLIIEQLGFTLKAVGGDAHDVIIRSTAMSEPFQDIDPLLKNQTRYIELYYKYGYMSKKTEKGFPIEIKIWSLEAEGTINVILEY